jgi:hypothetical protein
MKQIAIDAFGNAIGQSIKDAAKRASSEELLGDVGLAMRQAAFTREVLENLDSQDAEDGLASRQSEFERLVADNQEREQLGIGDAMKLLMINANPIGLQTDSPVPIDADPEFILMGGLGKKTIETLYDSKRGPTGHELRGHHKFDENLAKKYDEYMSPDALDAAAMDRIGQGHVSRGLPGDPHAGRSGAHRAATDAIDVQMQQWIDAGKISKEKPMSRSQYYEFMREAQKKPAVGEYWKAINDFVDLMEGKGYQPKLKGIRIPRGPSQ